MSDLFNPFRYLAGLLVDLLPAGASELLVGSAALLGLMLLMMLIALPGCALAADIERHLTGMPVIARPE